MKLNLLPSTVSKGAALRNAAIAATVLLLLAVLASAFMIVSARDTLAKAKERSNAARPQYDKAVATAQMAETVMSDPGTVGLFRNVALANSMDEHNAKYPAFYREVLPYVPAFFRATSVSVTSGGADSVTLTLTGVVETAQQYADLMLALYRIPGARSVARSGFVFDDPTLPNVVEGDQNPEPLAPGESRLPTDPVARMDALIARAAAEPAGFSGIGNFGAAETAVRGAMPDWSAVTIIVEIAADPTLPPAEQLTIDLMVPDPGATLGAGGGAAGGFGGGGFGGPGGPPPGFGGPGGPPPGVGGPPAAFGGRGGPPGNAPIR